MDSKDKSRTDEKSKTHKRHKGKKKKEANKVMKDTSSKGTGNKRQHHQTDQDRAFEGIETTSHPTPQQANKGAEHKNVAEAASSEPEMESKGKANEDMEIHSRIDPESDTIEGPLAQRK